jgi:hypothetical protein
MAAVHEHLGEIGADLFERLFLPGPGAKAKQARGGRLTSV